MRRSDRRRRAQASRPRAQEDRKSPNHIIRHQVPLQRDVSGERRFNIRTSYNDARCHFGVNKLLAELNARGTAPSAVVPSNNWPRELPLSASADVSSYNDAWCYFGVNNLNLNTERSTFATRHELWITIASSLCSDDFVFA